MVPPSEPCRITRPDYVNLIEELEFYAAETMGPYVIPDSERARAALEKRLPM